MDVIAFPELFRISQLNYTWNYQFQWIYGEGSPLSYYKTTGPHTWIVNYDLGKGYLEMFEGPNLVAYSDIKVELLPLIADFDIILGSYV